MNLFANKALTGIVIGIVVAFFVTFGGWPGLLWLLLFTITGITLIAGFASTVGWPLSAWLERVLGRGPHPAPQRDLIAQMEEIKDWRNLLCHAVWRPAAGGWQPVFANTRGELYEGTIDTADLAAIRAMTLDAARRAGRLIEGLDEGSGASD